MLTVLIYLLVLLQQRPATIQGVVTDASGAVIVDATVSISAANVQRSAQTEGDGTFSFPSLAAGDYTLKLSYPGFEPFEQQVTAESGLTLVVSIRLRPQVYTQALTVTEDRGPNSAWNSTRRPDPAPLKMPILTRCRIIPTTCATCCKLSRTGRRGYTLSPLTRL